MANRRDVLLGLTGAAATTLATPYLRFSGLAVAAEPARGGDLKVATIFEPASLDPILGTSVGADRSIFNLYSENLVYQDVEGVIHPLLAESWELTPDEKALIFKLRPGVSFQDGTKFDAEAVKFNLDRVANPDVHSTSRQYMGDYAGTEVIDPLTVKVNLKNPSGPFLTILTNEAGSMVSPTAVRERGADFARNPVGTGPYVITSWGSGKVDAKRFDGYWGKPPHLDTVSVRIIPNTAVKLVELKSGNVQLGDIVQPKDFPEIEADPNLDLLDTAPIQTIIQLLHVNNQSGPLAKNLDLRKAISHAIDREALAKVITRGWGGAMTGFEPPSSPMASDAIKGHTYDPALARELYKKSGHTAPLTMILTQRDPDTQIAQIVQSMCKECGIDVRVQTVERLTLVEMLQGKKYELALARANSRPDPDMTYSNQFGRNSPNDYSAIQSPELWEMIEKARGLSDMAVRKQIYVDIQQKILDNYWQIYLCWRAQKEVKSKKLNGFSREFCGAWRYNDMSLSES